MYQLFGTWTVAVVVMLSLLGCADREDGSSQLNIGEGLAPDSRRQRTVLSSDSVNVHQLVRRQVLYVPAYAHIFFQDERRTVNLATTLSIHNTDPQRPIQLTAVEYYNSEGNLVRQHLERPKTLGPFASTWYVVEESDLSGGVGANFIVEWEADQPASPPAVETVMISTAHQQGISFTSQARVLEQE